MRYARFVLPLLVSLTPAAAFAHVRLLFPVPRSPEAGKFGPCGGYPRGDEPLVLEAGTEILVEYEEFIDHPGYYRIFLLSNSDTSALLLADRLPDKPRSGTANDYSTTITLPDQPCEDCTLQLIQVMTENPNNPELYFSCADVRITAPVVPPDPFRRGDANADGRVDVSDGVAVFEYLFRGNAAVSCLDAADTNDDGRVDISDGISSLGWLFQGGPEPSTPGPSACGEDPTEDPMTACEYPQGLCG